MHVHKQTHILTPIMSKIPTFFHDAGVIFTIVCVSYFFSKSPVAKRMFCYNHHYFLPAGFICIKVGFEAITLLSCSLFVAVSKTIDQSLVPPGFHRGFPSLQSLPLPFQVLAYLRYWCSPLWFSANQVSYNQMIKILSLLAEAV